MEEIKTVLSIADKVTSFGLLVLFIFAMARGWVRWGKSVEQKLSLKDEIIAVHKERADKLEEQWLEEQRERSNLNNQLLESVKAHAHEIALLQQQSLLSRERRDS